MAKLFPSAAVSTLVLDRRALGGDLPTRVFEVSLLRHLAPRWVAHRKLLPLFPWAVGRLKVPPGTSLLITSDAAVIKGMPRPSGCMQICYCHTPPRYLWDQLEAYARSSSDIGAAGRIAFRWAARRVRRFDAQAAARVDHFVANSSAVAERIRRSYGRESVVIHPPVSTDRFTPVDRVDDYFLVVAELVSYKRVDLAVRACSILGRRLIVVGDGPEEKRLRAMAGPSVEFRGRVDDATVAALMARARAFLNPQLEDFGIAAVEAQAAGRPVIAYGAGGACDTVIPDVTGVFFDDPGVADLSEAIRHFESIERRFCAERCRENALRFSAESFRKRFMDFVEEKRTQCRSE